MFIIRSKINPKLILGRDGNYHVESLIGPGGFAARIYKTRIRAEQAALIKHGVVYDI